MANVGRVAISLNVHCPLASPSSQKKNTISEPALRTTNGVMQGRIVYAQKVNDAVLKGVRRIYMHKVIMHRKGDVLEMESDFK